MYSQVQRRRGNACNGNYENIEEPSGYEVSGYKRRRWSPEEDKKLTDIIGRHGACNWSYIGELHGTRDGKQCRERWMYHIGPNINKSPLSNEEIALVMKMQARYGNKWSNISAMMPGRTASSIKNHWNTVMSKKQRVIAKKNRSTRSTTSEEMWTEETFMSENGEYSMMVPEKAGRWGSLGISGFQGHIRLNRHMAHNKCNRKDAFSQQTYRAPGRTECTCFGSHCSTITSEDESPRLLLLGEYDEEFLNRLHNATGIEFISLSFKDIEAATHLATYAAYLKRTDKTEQDSNGRMLGLPGK